MKEVCGIRFNTKGKVYYFDRNNLNIKMYDRVIVVTERGEQFGYVEKDFKEIEEKNLISPLKSVIRIATARDIKQQEKNEKDNMNALIKAKEIVEELELPMILLDANYTFDRKQLLFNFIADERIDFRELAKKLAAIYKTRIELRQIGIRDKAREVGGIGPCGRFLCCNSFLTDLNSVTINMAKNQNLALNPTKINGVCGRLLCCLSYEDEIYTDLKKNLPSIGEIYKHNGKNYKVIDVDVISKKITIENDDTKEVINL